MAGSVRAGDHLKGVFADLFAGRLGDGLFQHPGTDILDRRAGGAGDFTDNMRLIIVSAVDQGTEAGDHLDHGHVKILSERIGCQIRQDHFVRAVNRVGCVCFAGQVDTGLQAEVKGALIFAEGLSAHRHGLIHQSHVAGTLNRLSQGQDAVSVYIVAFDRLGGAHVQPSLAVIGLIARQRTALQAGSRRERLGGGTGLVIILNAEVFPQGVQIFGTPRRGFLVIAFQRVYEILRQVIAAGLVASALIQLRHSDQDAQIIRIVEVIIRIAGHSEDFACVDLHDDAADVVGAVSLTDRVLMLVVEFLQVFLDNALDIRIDGQNQILPVRRFNGRPLQVGHIVQETVLAPRRAVQCVIVILFQTEGAVVAAVRESDHIAGQCLVGIAADIAGFERNALDFLILRHNLSCGFKLGAPGGDFLLVLFALLLGVFLVDLIDQFLHQKSVLGPLGLVGGLGLIRDLFGRDIITGIGVLGNIRSQFGAVCAQRFGRVQRGLQIFVLDAFGQQGFRVGCVLQDMIRVHNHVVDQFAVRQDGALAVCDHAALVRKRPAVVMALGKDLLFIGSALVPVDEPDPCCKHSKSQQYHDKQECQLSLHIYGKNLRASFFSFSAHVCSFSYLPTSRD